MRAPLVAAVAAAVLLLGACSGDEEPEDDPSAAPSATDTGSPSPSPSEPSPSETTPTAPAATGPLLETSAFTIRGANDDYVARVVSGDAITSLSDLRAGDNVYFSVKQDYDDFTLEEVAAIYASQTTYVGRLKRLPDTEIAGQPAVHLTGKTDGDRAAEVYIMLRDGVVVEIDFEMLIDEPKRSQVIASMLASFTWK